MKIFIVGGAGYIGSHMVKTAYKANHQVITIDNLSTGHKDSVLFGKFEFCDILDRERLDKLFKSYNPDVVMHFSAYSSVGESVIDPYKYYHNNVVGTLNILKSMIDNDCKKFIFSSSATIFGIPDYIPIDEDHPKRPVNPYGKSKLMVEEILKDFESAYDLKYVSFRYFNAAGHDPEGELSERHEPETHLLPLVLQAVNGQRDSVNIYGNDYDTKDGTCVRDYIHVNDLVNAHLKGIGYLNNRDSSSAEFNLGTGNGYSVKEIIQKVKEITQKDFKVLETARRDGDSAVLIASSDKAKKQLEIGRDFIDIEKIIKTLM